ncbi:MAG TPA: sigma-70 family RNA polymerase sigma factor, partial [Polyangiaceae bacterium]|nr:sigma-70 family RNA polymerase sigma factor [Polyangiaceae bacterium]
MLPAARASEDEALSAASDAELVARMRAGERAAFGALYDRHAAALYAVALRMLGTAAEAQDLLHDVFLEAWEHAGEYDAAKGAARTWLFVRLRSRALDRLGRAEATRTRPLGDDSEELDAASRTSGEHEPVDAVSVRRALERIDEAVQQVLELTFFGGFT